MSKDKKPKNPVSDEQVDKKWGGSANRVFRGGGWYDDARFARLSRRLYLDPSYRNHGYLGFRIVRNTPKDPKDNK